MSDLLNALERAERGSGLDGAPPSLERFVSYRDRRRRNQRIATVVIALIIAAAAIGGAITVFRQGIRQRPAGTDETSKITRENVGDLGLAWTASLKPGLFPPVAHDGSVFVPSDRLYEFREDCRTDGGTCEPSWSAPMSGAPGGCCLSLDGDTLYAGSKAYDLTCSPDPCLIGDLPLLKANPFPYWGSVVDGIAFYAYGDRGIAAASCERDEGTGEGTCGLLWTASIGPPEPSNWHFFWGSMTVADGKVFVSVKFAINNGGNYPAGDAYAGLYAFDAGCRDDGGTCDPSWFVPGEFGPGPTDTPVVADGVVFVTKGSFLDAFAEDCGAGGATCEPLWQARIGSPHFHQRVRQGPVAGDGVVYVRNLAGVLSAFPTTCTPEAGAGNGGFCDPLWTADLGLPTPADGKLLIHHAVYAADCGRGGAGCEPLWTSARGSFPPAAVADGVVYLPGPRNEIDAYDLNCRTDGGECRPSWTQRVQGTIRTTGLVVADGGVYYGCCNGTLYAFRVAAGKRGPGLLVPVAGIALALAVGLTLFVGRRRARRRAAVR